MRAKMRKPSAENREARTLLLSVNGGFYDRKIHSEEYRISAINFPALRQHDCHGGRL
jgi:hypothetical protein